MNRSWYWLIAVLFGSTCVVQATMFNFDNGSPALSAGQNLPFDQTSGGLTAHFSAVSGYGGFSVQSDASTHWTLSQFSGFYLDPNGLNPGPLNIKFSQPVTSITFTTADFQQVEVPTSVQLLAYLDSTSNIIGSATAHGTYGSDTMPMGTLSFASAAPFNLVAIGISPGQPLGASDVLVDNINVTPAAANVPEPASYAIAGLVLLSLGLLRRRSRARRK